MSQFWSPLVKRLHPYTPGEQPKEANLIKLNTNENPYGPSPKVQQRLHDTISDSLRLYPDPNAVELKTAIAKYYQIPVEQVFVGNGSDEVLAHAFQGLLNHQQPLLFPDISYSFYPTYSKLYDIEYQQIPLTDAFEIDVNDYARENGGIIFPNPNAPTGIQLPLASIERLLAANSGSVVVVDEAYIDFGGDSAIALVERFPNLLVIQTLSKSRSLAGIRVGFAIGQPELIEALERVKNSFNSYPLDRLAITGAVAAIEDRDYFDATIAKVIHTRETLTEQLSQLGFEVLPSKTNFVFVRHPQHDAAEIAQLLRKQGIIVRHFNSDRIDQFLRITIGTDQECNALSSALAAICQPAQ
ncbi:MAG: histidinol-phosphate transaminase [Halopseudomonas sp.]